MSYYTHFETKELTLRKDTPENVIQFLQKAFSDHVDKEDILLFNLTSDFDFFKDDRGSENENFRNFDVFRGCKQISYFIFRNGYWRLKIKSDLNKCYGLREINFSEWISQYISGHKKQNYIAYYTTEENNEQTHIVFDGSYFTNNETTS